ncbi:DUF4352 domain-containing protein [Streptomyces thermolilacinus]
MNQQPHQPHPHQPGPYGLYPPPQPPRPPRREGLSAGAIVAITLGGVVGGLLLIGMVAALLTGGTGDGPRRGTPAVAATGNASAAPGDEKPPSEPRTEPERDPRPEAEQRAPFTLTAKRTAFRPSVLHDGGEYTSVTVTITNRSDKPLGVNPLYFSLTDTSGGRHVMELGMDEGQIDTVELAPGEKLTGTVTGEGRFTPRHVTFTEGLFGDPVRAPVS